MVARFRLPYTERQVYAMLLAACKSEVALRHRRFIASDAYLKHIADIARWLTSDDTTFGLFLCGNRGNGKKDYAGKGHEVALQLPSLR